jgi:hypothetical protein
MQHLPELFQRKGEARRKGENNDYITDKYNVRKMNMGK